MTMEQLSMEEWCRLRDVLSDRIDDYLKEARRLGEREEFVRAFSFTRRASEYSAIYRKMAENSKYADDVDYKIEMAVMDIEEVLKKSY